MWRCGRGECDVPRQRLGSVPGCIPVGVPRCIHSSVLPGLQRTTVYTACVAIGYAIVYLALECSLHIMYTDINLQCTVYIMYIVYHVQCVVNNV